MTLASCLGIYFADMVSKSANYCCTSRTNNTGLLLLCDVALGNMYEARKAEYVEKLPTGFHSTKGLGKTAPDASNVKEIDGSMVSKYIDNLVDFSFLLLLNVQFERILGSLIGVCKLGHSCSLYGPHD